MQILFAGWQQLQSIWPNISLVLGLLWLLYIALLGAWILLQKREPIATLSWLLCLALLPFIGFLIYHFLGPTRIKRQNLKRSKAKAGLMPLTVMLCALTRPLAVPAPFTRYVIASTSPLIVPLPLKVTSP